MHVLFRVLYVQYLINEGDIRHMVVVGYARASSVGQSLEVQQEKLVSYGVDKLFAEKLSSTTAARPELKSCLEYVREGLSSGTGFRYN